MNSMSEHTKKPTAGAAVLAQDDGTFTIIRNHPTRFYAHILLTPRETSRGTDLPLPH